MPKDFFIEFRGEQDVCIQYSGSTQQCGETGASDLEWWFQEAEKQALQLTDEENTAITNLAFEHAEDSETDDFYG